METIRKSISITHQQDHRINERIAACHYDGEKRSLELETIRAALREGESSGNPRLFDLKAFKQRMLIVQD